MNLRLSAGDEAALRARSAASGTSQQELLRAALRRYLADGQGQGEAAASPQAAAPSEADRLVATGRVCPPRRPYRRPTPVEVGSGAGSAELLDRGERL